MRRFGFAPWSFAAILATNMGCSSLLCSNNRRKKKSLYYGWVIVVVGFLAHIASAFSISSTLSVFLKPLSADLGISRGAFSLIRSGEILIGAAAAPVVGTLMDR